VLRKANHSRQVVPLHVTKVSIRQHTSAYVSMRVALPVAMQLKSRPRRPHTYAYAIAVPFTSSEGQGRLP
jgi:hypothetical protein